MRADPNAPSYKGFRFPQEIIAHTIWLYVRVNLCYRDAAGLLAERGHVIQVMWPTL